MYFSETALDPRYLIRRTQANQLSNKLTIINRWSERQSDGPFSGTTRVSRVNYSYTSDYFVAWLRHCAGCGGQQQQQQQVQTLKPCRS